MLSLLSAYEEAFGPLRVLRYITEAIPPDQRQSRGVGRKANLSPKGGYAGPPGKGY